MVVAHKSSTEEIGILRKVFQKYDKRRDGSIGYEDFCNALSEFGHSDGDMKEMFDAVVSGSGTTLIASVLYRISHCLLTTLFIGFGWNW